MVKQAPSTADIFAQKTKLSIERNARKKANKQKNHLAKVQATGPMEFSSQINGGWVQYGPMVNGHWTITQRVQFQGTGRWEDDPGARATIKTPTEILKEQIDANLQNWPWRQAVPRKLVTLAPFLVNSLRGVHKPSQPFTKPEVKQACLLFSKLFTNELIVRKITDLLFQNHDTAWKFAATSRSSFRVVTFYIGVWDFTRGWFGNCEHPRDQFLDPDNLIAEPIQGSVPSVVIVSPVRGPKKFPKNIEDLDEVKDKVDQHLYEDQVRSLHKMCVAMSNFADYFRNLQLHRIPFLTTEVLELIVPMMRNLKVLGVYQCQLIHVGETLRLLEIIRVDKVTEKQNQIKLDFYPNYHVGPIDFPGYKYCTGSFGATWDNWNGDTRLSIWQLVLCIFPLAAEYKQDFWSKHTMFRQWLDKSPCWRVSETLATLVRGKRDRRTDAEVDEEFALMVDSPNTQGSGSKFKSKQPNRPEGWEWKLERHPCHVCRLNPLGMFFPYDDICEATNQGLTGNQLTMVCYACRLVNVLNGETDHYKLMKREVVSQWLREDDDADGWEVWNTNSMPKALESFKEREVAKWGWKLDCKRAQAMKHKDFPLDRENDEIQLPLQPHEGLRQGMKHRSPTVQSKDPAWDEWNYINRDREWAHGHGV